MRPFFYDRDFDAELEGEEAAAVQALAPQPAAITRADLETARAEGHKTGYEAGRAEAEAATEARMQAARAQLTAETLAALVPQLSELRASRAAHHDRLEHDLMQLVQALAERLLPEIFDAFAQKRVTAFCKRALRMAEGAGGLELRLPADLSGEVTAELHSALTAEGAPVRVIQDPDLPAGEARALWDQGQARFALAPLHHALLATLATLTPPAQDKTHE